MAELIGNRIEGIIRRATRGRIKPCGGCKKRRDALNQGHQAIRDLINGRHTTDMGGGDRGLLDDVELEP